MENTENMEVVRDRMLGGQSQQHVKVPDSPDDLMDVETNTATETEGRDVPIDYSTAGRGTSRDSGELPYKGGYGAKMTLNPEDVNRFTTRNQQEGVKGSDVEKPQVENSNESIGRNPQQLGPPVQSQGKLQDFNLAYADPNLLSRSAP